jgi:hypothetical protein
MRQAIGFVLLLAVCSLALITQDKPDIEKEKAAIKQAALDYAEGYYEGSAERMERAIHPLLCKRGLVKANDQGDPFLVFMNSEVLIEAARSGRGKVDPDKRNISVTVLDLNENTASAKVFTVQFNDFLHLAKVNGQWRIVNVLWRPPVQQPAAATAKARDEVKKVLADLREAANAKDPDRAKTLIHPEIVRRTYAPGMPGGKMILQDVTGETLLQIIRMGRAAAPKDQPQPEVTIFDVYENMASVKSSRPGGIEYMHLAQQNGQWRIVNILATTFQQPAGGPK